MRTNDSQCGTREGDDHPHTGTHDTGRTRPLKPDHADDGPDGMERAHKWRRVRDWQPCPIGAVLGEVRADQSALFDWLAQPEYECKAWYGLIFD